jgi:hypothetical protein
MLAAGRMIQKLLGNATSSQTFLSEMLLWPKYLNPDMGSVTKYRTVFASVITDTIRARSTAEADFALDARTAESCRRGERRMVSAWQGALWEDATQGRCC